MKLFKAALAAISALCLALGAPAYAADNVAVTPGSGKTMACLDIATVCFTKHILYNSSGTEIDFSTSTVTWATGLPVFPQVQTGATGVPSPAVGATANTSTTLLAKSSAGNLTAWGCHAHATAGMCILYNDSAAPSAGALTAAKVIRCKQMAATSDFFEHFGNPGMRMSLGAVVIFSSDATSCANYTASSTAHLFALIQ